MVFVCLKHNQSQSSTLVLPSGHLFNTMFDNCIILQKKSLLSLYETKVKDIVKKLLTLDGNSEMYVLGKIVLLLISLCFLSG